MDTWLSNERLLFKLGWTEIAEGRMAALPVIEHFKIFKDVPRGFVAGLILPMMHEFGCQVST